jgi:hypothetical protein
LNILTPGREKWRSGRPANFSLPPTSKNNCGFKAINLALLRLPRERGVDQRLGEVGKALAKSADHEGLGEQEERARAPVEIGVGGYEAAVREQLRSYQFQTNEQHVEPAVVSSIMTADGWLALMSAAKYRLFSADDVRKIMNSGEFVRKIMNSGEFEAIMAEYMESWGRRACPSPLNTRRPPLFPFQCETHQTIWYHLTKSPSPPSPLVHAGFGLACRTKSLTK